MNEEYLVSCIEKDGNLINLPEITLHLMILYILSMLSRYHIHLWGERSLELEKGDFYMIKQFLRVSTRKYPNIVLNALMNNNYIFTSELYRPLDSRIKHQESQITKIVENVLEKKRSDKRFEEILKGEEKGLF